MGSYNRDLLDVNNFSGLEGGDQVLKLIEGQAGEIQELRRAGLQIKWLRVLPIGLTDCTFHRI